MEEDVKYYTLPPKVTAFFGKDLTGEANEISYETYTGSEQTSIALSIEQLEVLPRDLKASSQKHTDTYFQGFTAQLVLFYGSDGGVLSKSSKFQGIDISYTENKAFIHWKIDSIGALESIANSIHRNKKLFVRVEMLTHDDTFNIPKNSEKLRLEVDTISLSFE
jgi:hypothetical protein